ncbi:YhcH/YjgK/YiaL family protein [Streptococcus sp. E29BA]|uniref:YhcH/YjgK/YiaL family protein n=1 Tax=Streptococcus sp. E29BA TaxID=3278716 RepID=UPI00359E244F
MIYDDLSKLDRYKGLHTNIDTAIDYLLKTDLSQLEIGRHTIDGDKVFLLLQDNTLNSEPSESFEYHAKYMDLQLLVSGNENFRYTRTIDADLQPFNEADDFGLIRSSVGLDFELDGQTFIMVYPGEYHQPSQLGKAGYQVKKGVIKILID